MDAYSAYAYSTAAWLSLQALPLFVSPKLIVTMLSPETRAPTGKVPQPRKTLNPPAQANTSPLDLEIYLSRTLALTVLALAHLNILLSGALPLSQSRKRSRTLPLQNPRRVHNNLLPHLELDIRVRKLHGDRLGVFCVGDGGEWVSGVLWAVGYDVWGG